MYIFARMYFVCESILLVLGMFYEFYMKFSIFRVLDVQEKKNSTENICYGSRTRKGNFQLKTRNHVFGGKIIPKNLARKDTRLLFLLKELV